MMETAENAVHALLERDTHAQELAVDFIRRYQPFYALPKDVAGLILLGYGWKVQKHPISEEAALAMLRTDVDRSYLGLRAQLHALEHLSAERAAVLFHLAFVLTPEVVLRMESLWSALRRHDYDTACDEILLSEWPALVGNDPHEKVRALAILRAMRTGSFHPPEVPL